MLSDRSSHVVRGVGRLLVAAALAATAAADPPYVVSKMSSDDQTGVDSRAYDINNLGQVIGWSRNGDGNRHSTHWHNQVMTDLHGITHFELLQDFTVGVTEAYAISDADQVVGTGQVDLKCQDRTIRVYHAFVMRPAVLSDLGTANPGDAATDLWTFGNPCTAYNSAATAISNANHVVGWADMNNAATIRAYLIRPQNGVWYRDQNADLVNDLLIDLGTLGGAESAAHGVNDSGVVTGYSYLPINQPPARYHAFILTPSGGEWFRDSNNDGVNDLMQSIGTLGGGNSWGRAINSNNVIVGESDTATQQTHAFRWENGTMTDLGTLGGPSSSAADINDAGQIVGWAENDAGERRAVVWAAGTITDLNSALIYGESTGGIVLTEARAVNEAGQITGYGLVKGGGGKTRAFLLTPATPAQIAAAAAAEAAANSNQGESVAGTTAGSGGSPGGQYTGTPITGTPGNVTLLSGNGGDPNAAEGSSSSNLLTGLCGTGLLGFLPLMVLGAIGLRRPGRADCHSQESL
jgi:probable HAF family extracellular repeat protein